jgi:hypothetical protein
LFAGTFRECRLCDGANITGEQIEAADNELAALCRRVEGFDPIEEIEPEMRALIEEVFPDLLHKLPSGST